MLFVVPPGALLFIIRLTRLSIYMSPAFLYLQHLAHESHVRSRYNTPPTSNFLSLATFWLGLLVGDIDIEH